jgi:cytochrome P450
MSSTTELPEAVENDGGFDEVIVALATPECHQDPYPLYARMRREHPVYRSSQGIWYLTRYADVEAAVHDLRLSNDRERMTRALAARQGNLQRLSRLTRRLGRVVSNTILSTLALLRHPDQLRRLRQDPRLIRSGIQELARYDSPSHMIIRVVAEAVQIGGQTLAEGDLVYLVLAAANRDPDRFPDPDQLDLGRCDNRHLSFGNEPRFCLGAPLARLQGEIAIGTLVRRLPMLRLDTETVRWQPSPTLRGPASLPIAY